MSKKTFQVWQQGEIWYTTEVEAASLAEAKEKVIHPSFKGKWELDYDTLVMVDGPLEIQEKEED
jgi:hypothetical protein